MAGSSGEATAFRDRSEAGERLARRLAERGWQTEKEAEELEGRPVVYALPRGGVPVGYEVSRALGAPLEVLVCRKLGAPGQPELGIGAVSADGVRYLNRPLVERLGVTGGYVEKVTAEEAEEADRRARMLRGEHREISPDGRTAIVVDDGLATGATARAAVESLGRRGARRVVVAVPVCADQTRVELEDEGTDLFCLVSPERLGAIGLWYRDFTQVTDGEVLDLLRRTRPE